MQYKCLCHAVAQATENACLSSCHLVCGTSRSSWTAECTVAQVLQVHIPDCRVYSGTGATGMHTWLQSVQWHRCYRYAYLTAECTVAQVLQVRIPDCRVYSGTGATGTHTCWILDAANLLITLYNSTRSNKGDKGKVIQVLERVTSGYPPTSWTSRPMRCPSPWGMNVAPRCAVIISSTSPKTSPPALRCSRRTRSANRCISAQFTPVTHHRLSTGATWSVRGRQRVHGWLCRLSVCYHHHYQHHHSPHMSMIAVYQVQIFEIRPEPDVAGYPPAYPATDSVMSAAMPCMLMMCMKLCNLCINCSVLMSVIWFVAHCNA